MGSGEGDLWETDHYYCSAFTFLIPHGLKLVFPSPSASQTLTQHSSEEPTVTCATQDRVEWGDESWLSMRGTAVCERKKKQKVLLLSAEKKKVCPSRGKSLDCKWQGQYHPLESSCQVWIFHFKKLYNITTLWTTETPSLGKMWTLAELVPYQEECLHPCHIGSMSSLTQCNWDSRLLQLLGPTMERDGSRLRLCFSFNGLAGCVQGPGVNLFSGCSRLGSLGREKR